MAEQLQAALFARRIVSVSGPLDERTAGDTAAALLTLDALGDDPIDLRIDCPTAPLGPAFTVMDTIDAIGVPVVVTCVGTAGQGAAGVLAVGTHRRINPHGRVHLGQPEVRFVGRATEIEAASAHHADHLAQFQRRLARATSHPLEHLEADMAASRLLDAAAAQAYGLVDEILGQSEK
jgi:ATP-dependent Clp protease protease subunit